MSAGPQSGKGLAGAERSTSKIAHSHGHWQEASVLHKLFIGGLPSAIPSQNDSQWLLALPSCHFSFSIVGNPCEQLHGFLSLCPLIEVWESRVHFCCCTVSALLMLKASHTSDNTICGPVVNFCHSIEVHYIR